MYSNGIACFIFLSIFCQGTSCVNSISPLPSLLCDFCSTFLLFFVFCSTFSLLRFFFISAPASCVGAARAASNSASPLKDTRASPALSLSDSSHLCGGPHLGLHVFSRMVTRGSEVIVRLFRTHGFGGIAIVRWGPDRRGGGPGVVTSSWSVVTFCLPPKICSCVVSRRSTTKWRFWLLVAPQGLAMSKIPPATELIQFGRPS